MVDESHGRDNLEPPDVATRPVLLAALGSLALVVGAIWLLAGVYAWQVPNRTLPRPKTFPQPRVETHQAEQRHRIQAEQRRRLSEYRWADPSKTLVEIPIERAMKIIAGRGPEAYGPLVPAAAALASPTAGAQRAVTPGQGPPGSGAPAAQSGSEAKP